MDPSTRPDPTAALLRSVPKILAMLNARVSKPLSRADLDDVVQDATVILLGKIDRVEGPAPAGAYIFRVCELELRNGIRRCRRRMVCLDAPDSIEARGQGPGVEAAEFLRWAMRQVGGVEAEAVHLKHVVGLTFSEIGHRLDVPANTVKTRYYKGISKLQRVLKRREDPGDAADSGERK